MERKFLFITIVIHVYCKNFFQFSFLNPHPKTCLLIFRERGRKGEREGKKHYVREKH